MSKQYPFLSASYIEAEAEKLRTSSKYYVNDHRGAVTPIESVAEFDLGLKLDFDDLKKMFQLDGSTSNGDQILGAMVFSTRQILIDETLDPDENPRVEGRFRFTVAHEIAHWMLHRHLFVNELKAVAMLQDGPQGYLLRQKTPNARLEWQANYYASCILMPRIEIERAWYHLTGSMRPFGYEACRAHLDVPYLDNPWKQIGGSLSFLDSKTVSPNLHADREHVFRLISRELASQLNVSTQSMQFRLQELGWII